MKARLLLLPVLLACLLPGAAIAADVSGATVSATFGPDGRLWRVLGRAEYIELDWSADHGQSFAPAVRVNPEAQQLAVQPEGRPELVFAADGRLFVSWTAFDGTGPAVNVAWSEDQGQSFSAPLTVPANISPPPQLRAHLHADPAGQVRLFWIDPVDLAGDPQRQPGGALYVGEINPGASPALGVRRLSGMVCECCRLATVSGQDGLPLLFGRFVWPESIRDLGLLQLNANGAAPSLQRISEDQWQLEACPDHGPALARAEDGRLQLFWFTQGSSRQGLFHAWSDDGGKSISPPLAVGARERLAGHGDVLAAGQQVVLAWRQFDGEAASVHVQLSADGGESFSAPRQLARAGGATDYPQLLSDGETVWLSWYSREHGYQLLKVMELR